MKRSNPPVMHGEKTCIKCTALRPVTDFHAHKQMADGRLNKCKVCVVRDVDEWRNKKPDARKIEHARNREKKGFRTREQWAANLKANAKGHKVTGLEWYYRNTEAVAAYHRVYAEQNRDAIRARNAAHTRKKRESKDPAFLSARVATQSKRRAAQLRAIPSWSIEEDTAQMYEVARVFRRIGIDMQVDHIVPLQGKSVCGLHVVDNLQLMVGSQNSAKHNRHWPDMP